MKKIILDSIYLIFFILVFNSCTSGRLGDPTVNPTPYTTPYFYSGSGATPSYSISPVQKTPTPGSVTITELSYSPQNPDYNSKVKITAKINNPDNAPLKYTWNLPGLILENKGTGEILWQPDSAGTFRVLLDVYDIKGNKLSTKTTYIKVLSPSAIPTTETTPTPIPTSVPTSIPTPISTAKPDDRIVFLSNRTGFWEVYIMNSDGSNQTQLTNDKLSGPFSAKLSSDGKKIAYISDQPNHTNLEIWIMNSDGTNKEQLTSSDSIDEDWVSWSPDNQKLAFHSHEQTNNSYHIWTINVSGGGRKQITTDNKKQCFNPDWSPDGKKILYSGKDQNGNTNLFTINIDGTNDTQITNDNMVGSGVWSPDGTKILYLSKTNPAGFYVINPDGTEKNKLNTIQNSEIGFSYSPDGKKIVFTRGTPSVFDSFNIWIMDTNGNILKQITFDGGFSPHWK